MKSTTRQFKFEDKVKVILCSSLNTCNFPSDILYYIYFICTPIGISDNKALCLTNLVNFSNGIFLLVAL